MKVGVIGTGNMGENHVRTYLSLHDHCQLVGIYDSDEKKGQQIAKKYKVKQFQSMPDLLQSVDAVSIAVPTEFHYDIGLTCIRHKVHMLMEKPITSTAVQAEDLHHKAAAAGIKLQIGHIELFNPFIRYLIKELKKESIIGIDFLRMNPYDERIKNVDVVKDLMIHDLYILPELLDDEIVEFYALGNIMENTPKHAAVISRSSQGVTAQLTASFKAKRKIRTMQILTEDAFIEADILNNKIRRTYPMIEHTSHAPITVTENIQIDSSIQPLEIQLLDFLNCIMSDTEPSVTGKDGAKVLMITNEISKTIRNGKQ
ncbi:gfo/Idh/MocA family oxidoreductase [Virgibacillus dakarensis]|uniref:Oxidoreductase n=1 Tax=Lentibacillus populi TaxID=1827502 RepID=A0A9W5TYW9_9BACI|nr:MULTISPECIES: Gfo/Idh/MocA family oxidoreductase [Bacillaceae]MTW87812.1 gfo/Idh/MocA family oxidoreductase [Virgibacillus dakarensis]GGB49023.1 oxidoreductase [Lentibacillus populi]